MRKKDQFPIALLSIFFFFWLLLAVNPISRAVWLAENVLTAIFITFLILTYKRFRFSDTAYILLFSFLVLHTIGSHYTYTKMPLFEVLKNNFDLSRNHYDRLVHFFFGVCFYLPLHEFVSKKLKINGAWSYFIPFLVIISFKSIYEILEYLAVVLTHDPIIGTSFLGMQGDQWDAQNDVLLGTLGAGLSWFFLWMKKKLRM